MKNRNSSHKLAFHLLSIFLMLFSLQACEQKPKEEKITVQLTDTIPAPTLLFDIEIDSLEVVQSKIKKNEFLANILLPHNINYVTIDKLAKRSKDIFDVRKIAVGKNYTLLLSKDSSQQAQYFIYQPNAVEYIVYDLRDSITIKKKRKEITIQQKEVGGIINSSLYLTLQQADVSPYLAVKLSDIFAWSIDFYRIQKGDWFRVIYEERFVDGESIGIGTIKATEFNHFDRSYYAFYFDGDSTGRGEYYDEEANSLRKAFLKSPLKFSRLSSRFTMRRFHPVQKRWKAHLGTDYAAPRGTPIMATGDGVITKSGYTRGNGKYVKVKHNSAYSTQYLHMNRRNAKVGQFVKQGDIIGYVGSTGLATGPHVCYRFWKNGKQVDHLREDFPSAEPIKENYKATFENISKQVRIILDKIPVEKKQAV
ncbi:MAG: peptidoglycan DD-metalloendopeptidase family protein [Flavobacteriales bacterium]|nr:peptidoglycan DD-metalloendopeptidase family protein [Flavobacteriales bacterium]